MKKAQDQQQDFKLVRDTVKANLKQAQADGKDLLDEITRMITNALRLSSSRIGSQELANACYSMGYQDAINDMSSINNRRN